MSDILYIEGVYCTGNQCDTYTGKVNYSDLTSGNFNINSCSGKEAVVSLDPSTFNIDIDIDDQKRALKSNEFIMQSDGSLYINKGFGSDKLEITIKLL